MEMKNVKIKICKSHNNRYKKINSYHHHHQLPPPPLTTPSLWPLRLKLVDPIFIVIHVTIRGYLKSDPYILGRRGRNCQLGVNGCLHFYSLRYTFKIWRTSQDSPTPTQRRALILPPGSAPAFPLFCTLLPGGWNFVLEKVMLVQKLWGGKKHFWES